MTAGCEHEYQVSSTQGRVDFRDLIDGLQLGTPRLDPADPHAYRAVTGSVLTADQAEAEIALPPTPVRAGFGDLLAAHAEAEREWLAALLPGHDLCGFSTHISVSVATDAGVALAPSYARTFAPALMLLMDGRESPGLLVRPRPWRAELCGEYVSGARLRNAAVFAVGSIVARQTPPRLVARVEPGAERYGWYVDRRAFGPDLYASGRRTLLTRETGGSITAQEQLEAAWELARSAIAGSVDSADLDPVDRVVAGAVPLPCEGADPDATPAPHRPAWALAYGDVVQNRRRPGYDIACVLASWQLHVFLVISFDRARRAFVCCPGDTFTGFLARLDNGDLDGWLSTQLRDGPPGNRLDSRDKARGFGVWSDLGDRAALLAPERAIGGDLTA